METDLRSTGFEDRRLFVDFLLMFTVDSVGLGGRRHLMAKDSDKLRGSFDSGDGALSGLLADDEELDRGAMWRLGTWAAASIGAVTVALIANQSSIGVRHEQSASADLLKQAQQLQLTAKESQNETRRLASAIDTLNSDRDRLYSRVAVLEQGMDSVTGAIARQTSASPAPQSGAGQPSAGQASANQASVAGNLSQGNAAQATASPAVPAPTPSTASSPATVQTAASAPTAPATTASIDQSAAAAKPSSAPAVAAVAATTPAVTEKGASANKQDKQVAVTSSSEPGSSAKPATEQPGTQPSGSLVASKSMMAPPDPAAGKLVEPAVPPKAVTAAPLEIAAIAPKSSEETESNALPAAPELVAPHTEFGVDVGSANSIPGLRALWRGLLKSHSNAALTKLRPIIVIKENNNGLGLQLRLVAGPISDAAAAAKICASLTVSDRGCSTAVFEGQRLAFAADETEKAETSKPETSDKPASTASKLPSHRRYYSYAPRRPKAEDPPPKPEPSTLSSMIFGKRQ